MLDNVVHGSTCLLMNVSIRVNSQCTTIFLPRLESSHKIWYHGTMRNLVISALCFGDKTQDARCKMRERERGDES